MDTTTLPTNKKAGVHVQLPANLQNVENCINYLHNNGWIRKRFNYYNKRERRYARLQDIVPVLRNNNQAV